ncbi:hypothetical protein TYRP_018500 [Tyrophagus putrescentiae]|nr:hypothetical protein TYRP_018500 [Tyrophagus putrescentiae]
MSGPAVHPDVTWPLSTPSSSGPARCARETLVPALFDCTEAQAENGCSSERAKSESAQLPR